MIHVNISQKPLQYCKVISLQLIKISGKKIVLLVMKFCINGKKIKMKHKVSLVILFSTQAESSSANSPRGISEYFGMMEILYLDHYDNSTIEYVSQNSETCIPKMHVFYCIETYTSIQPDFKKIFKACVTTRPLDQC